MHNTRRHISKNLPSFELGNQAHSNILLTKERYRPSITIFNLWGCSDNRYFFNLATKSVIFCSGANFIIGCRNHAVVALLLNLQQYDHHTHRI
jgi:hypothetical protein